MAPMPACSTRVAHFLVDELLELLADRLDRAAGLGLQDDLEFGDLRLGLGVGERFEAHRRALVERRVAVLAARGASAISCAVGRVLRPRRTGRRRSAPRSGR